MRSTYLLGRNLLSQTLDKGLCVASCTAYIKQKNIGNEIKTNNMEKFNILLLQNCIPYTVTVISFDRNIGWLLFGSDNRQLWARIKQSV